MSAILNKIKQIRLEKGFSQDYMGQLLNIAQVTYGQIENGKRRLTVDMLMQIALILETDPSVFISLQPQIFKNYQVSDLPLKSEIAESEAVYMRSELPSRLKLESENEILRKENELLKKALEDKEKIIKLLERNKSQ